MNSAARLANILRQWYVPSGKSPWAVRMQEGQGDLETARNMASAAAVVHEVERDIDGLEAIGTPVGMYRARVLDWYKGIFSFDRPLGSSISGSATPAVDDHSLEILDALASTLSLIAPDSEILPSDRQSLMSLLDEALELVKESPEIPREDRIRILGLIIAAKTTLGHLDAVGTGELRTRVSELSLTLLTTANQFPIDADDAPSPTLRKKLAHLAWSTYEKVYSTGTTAVITAGADELMRRAIGH